MDIVNWVIVRYILHTKLLISLCNSHIFYYGKLFNSSLNIDGASREIVSQIYILYQCREQQ